MLYVCLLYAGIGPVWSLVVCPDASLVNENLNLATSLTHPPCLIWLSDSVIVHSVILLQPATTPPLPIPQSSELGHIAQWWPAGTYCSIEWLDIFYMAVRITFILLTHHTLTLGSISPVSYPQATPDLSMEMYHIPPPFDWPLFTSLLCWWTLPWTRYMQLEMKVPGTKCCWTRPMWSTSRWRPTLYALGFSSILPCTESSLSISWDVRNLLCFLEVSSQCPNTWCLLASSWLYIQLMTTCIGNRPMVWMIMNRTLLILVISCMTMSIFFNLICFTPLISYILRWILLRITPSIYRPLFFYSI